MAHLTGKSSNRDVDNSLIYRDTDFLLYPLAEWNVQLGAMERS